jgi:hypothetical protein
VEAERIETRFRSTMLCRLAGDPCRFGAQIPEPGRPVSGTVPGTAPGSVPGFVPGSVPGSAPGSVPGSAPGSVPGSVPGTAPPPMI